ncbi:spore maturation protein [Heyndrickxia sp. NPDC080065]|uniref:spore maturation protein n=1 Tax=Heyndrickxia sp. NPDC080065 TaxID=3390568 RepID=UPI003D011BC6
MFADIMKNISLYAIPFLLLVIPLYGMIRKVKVYESFTEGAKEGFTTAIKIIPYLVAILVAIGVFRASGALNMFTNLLAPIGSWIGMPKEVIPMALMRPLSGGGSQGIMVDLFKSFGPDSTIGNIASVISGSTETTFYVLAVYFGAIAVRNSRHALAAGLIADFVGIVASVIIVRLLMS